MANEQREEAVKEWECGVGGVTNAERNSFRDGYKAGWQARAGSVAKEVMPNDADRNNVALSISEIAGGHGAANGTSDKAESLSGAAPTIDVKITAFVVMNSGFVQHISTSRKSAEQYADFHLADSPEVEILQLTLVPEAQAPSLEKAQWISVSERMPQELENGYRWVRVWDEYWHTSYDASWDGEEWHPCSDREPQRRITHWQPLPSPPERQGNKI